MFVLFLEQEKCATVVDVAFLVDSSGSIRFRDYRKMKTFVSKMVEKFKISPAGSRAAVVQYSTEATTVIRFGVYTNSQAFERAVQGLRHERGYTRIDLALTRAYYDLFSARVNARFLVPKIAFVLTDGEQTKRFSYTPLDEASQRLKDVGVLLIAIGIGKSVKREELEQIASSERDVIIAKSFDDLLPAVESLIQTACEDIEGNLQPQQAVCVLYKMIKVNTEMLHKHSREACYLSHLSLSLTELKFYHLYFIQHALDIADLSRTLQAR